MSEAGWSSIWRRGSWWKDSGVKLLLLEHQSSYKHYFFGYLPDYLMIVCWKMHKYVVSCWRGDHSGLWSSDYWWKWKKFNLDGRLLMADICDLWHGFSLHLGLFAGWQSGGVQVWHQHVCCHISFLCAEGWMVQTCKSFPAVCILGKLIGAEYLCVWKLTSFVSTSQW